MTHKVFPELINMNNPLRLCGYSLRAANQALSGLTLMHTTQPNRDVEAALHASSIHARWQPHVSQLTYTVNSSQL